MRQMMGANKLPFPLQTGNSGQLVPTYWSYGMKEEAVDMERKIDDVRFVFIWKQVGFI